MMKKTKTQFDPQEFEDGDIVAFQSNAAFQKPHIGRFKQWTNPIVSRTGTFPSLNIPKAKSNSSFVYKNYGTDSVALYECVYDKKLLNHLIELWDCSKYIRKATDEEKKEFFDALKTYKTW